MQKNIFVVAAIAAMTASYAQADANVFGNIEQRAEIRGGTWNINGDDNFIGVKLSEKVGSDTTAYATISTDIGTETGSTASVRDQYIGLKYGTTSVQAGRFSNLEKQYISNKTDIFHGQSLKSNNQSWVDSAVAVIGDVGPLNVAGAVISDDTGRDKADAYELAGTLNVGSVGVTAYYSKNRTTDADTKAIALSGAVRGVDVSMTIERSGDNDTYTIVGALPVGGSNTLTAGYEKANNDTNTYVVELAHNFSKRVAGYVNYSDSDVVGQGSATMVGMNMSF